MVKPLTGYTFVTGDPPDLPTGQVFDYEVGSNGIFIHATRRGLHVRFPIGGPLPVRGLNPLEPLIKLTVPKLPAEIVRGWFAQARLAHGSLGQRIEVLWHAFVRDTTWHSALPPQEAGFSYVTLLGDTEYSSEVLLEAHSHHSMHAYFSATDTKDAQGFRLYAVIGQIDQRPEILFRVGVYGYLYPIAAALVCDLPPEITDMYWQLYAISEEEEPLCP